MIFINYLSSPSKSHSIKCSYFKIYQTQPPKLILTLNQLFYYSYNFEMPSSKLAVIQMMDDFSSKFLRMAANENEKLQLELGYHWKQKNSKMSMEGEQQSKNGSNRCYSDRQASQYFNLAMLFFSQINNQSSLDIDILDTLFFQQDHLIYYIYKDSRKGLTKIKQRGINACQTFLKRKIKKKQAFSSKERAARKHKPKSSVLTDQKSEKSIKQDLGYIALLKYKDGTFLRLKQFDLRSIFTNPLYANQKFRHNNCTQYIQSLSQEGTDEFKIHFVWDKYKEHPLAKLATSYQLGACDYGEKSALRREMLEHDQLVYLYFIIFQICSFICIHYNKRVQFGTFHFIKDIQTWSLAGIQSAKVTLLERKQYMKANLWEQNKKVTFGEYRQNEKQIFKLKEQAKSQFYKKVQNYFQETNNSIKNSMLSFVENKINNIKRNEDKLLSKTIFHILHPNKKNTNLYDLLDSPHHLSSLIKQNKHRRQKESQTIKSTIAVTQISSPRKPLMSSNNRKYLQSKFVYRGIEPIITQFSEFEE